MLESSANIFLLSELHNATSDQRGGENLVANIVYAIAFGLLAGGILSDCDFDCVMDYIMFIMALGLCLLNIVLCLL